MAPSLAACPASKSGTRPYLTLGGLEWPLIASILSRIQKGSAKFCYFFRVAENNKGFYFRKRWLVANWSLWPWSPKRPYFFLIPVWAEVLGAVFSPHFQWGLKTRASRAKAISAFLMWFDLTHYCFGSAFSTPTLMSSQCLFSLVANLWHLKEWWTPMDFFTEDLNADEREIVLQTEITQSIQHPNDIRDGTICNRSLAILMNIEKNNVCCFFETVSGTTMWTMSAATLW